MRGLSSQVGVKQGNGEGVCVGVPASVCRTTRGNVVHSPSNHLLFRKRRQRRQLRRRRRQRRSFQSKATIC